MTKVGIVCINLNPPYWQFIPEMLWGLDTFFLKHPSIKDKYETEFMVWSDVPDKLEDIKQKLAENILRNGGAQTSVVSQESVEIILEDSKKKDVIDLAQKLLEVQNKVKVFPTEPVEWPMPTLMRYHLFLQQEEYLQKFDYIFYIDVDMRITDWIGEEIFGDLTAAEHPMYSLRPNYYPPIEPNQESSAYIPRPGKVIVDENGKQRFLPYYYAGGFQGGKTQEFIKAMKAMRKNIDDDFTRNYIAIWNDESHWNRYLFDNPPSVVLSPAYIYPDSLVGNSRGDDYYVRLWGRNYSPKIMTLTKAFTTSQAGGDAVKQLTAL